MLKEGDRIMRLSLITASVALLALSAPALAQRHADLVYLQQFKARQKLLADADANKQKQAKQAPARQELATAPVPVPARTGDRGDANGPSCIPHDWNPVMRRLPVLAIAVAALFAAGAAQARSSAQLAIGFCCSDYAACCQHDGCPACD
jgi:hypothetical protein